jgi:hypothetical protein
MILRQVNASLFVLNAVLGSEPTADAVTNTWQQMTALD